MSRRHFRVVKQNRKLQEGSADHTTTNIKIETILTSFFTIIILNIEQVYQRPYIYFDLRPVFFIHTFESLIKSTCIQYNAAMEIYVSAKEEVKGTIHLHEQSHKFTFMNKIPLTGHFNEPRI